MKKSKMTEAQRRKASQLAKSNFATPSRKVWQSEIPLTGKAIALAGKTVLLAGTPVVFPEDDVAKAYEGKLGGVLWLADAVTGEKLSEYKLPSPPAWDTMAVAGGSVYLGLTDGRLICFKEN
jgi:hypothetical protein